ncbi:hypothetical protein [Streptacidiphilus sp. PAMC 29251]
MSTSHSARALPVVVKIAGLSIAALAVIVPVKSAVHSSTQQVPVNQVRVVADSQWGDGLHG